MTYFYNHHLLPCEVTIERTSFYVRSPEGEYEHWTWIGAWGERKDKFRNLRAAKENLATRIKVFFAMRNIAVPKRITWRTR